MRTSQELNFRGVTHTYTRMHNYSPFGPYFSKLTRTCSRVSPVFSFTPKLSKTSVADLVCAFSILLDCGGLDDQLAAHVVEFHLMRQPGGQGGGLEKAVISTDGRRGGGVSVGHLRGPPLEEKRNPPDVRIRRCCSAAVAAAALLID